MNGTRVLVLLPLLVGLAHCFSWDIVVGDRQELKFYNNGTRTHAKRNPSSKEIYSVVYDPVDLRVLFTDGANTNISICSYDLKTGRIKTLITKLTGAFYKYLAYDPLKKMLFWSEDYRIYSISLKLASSNTKFDGNVILTTNDYDHCSAIAMDSCGGYIYWATDSLIERAAFDGSGREVLVNSSVDYRRSLVIDQQTQRMFWIDQTFTYSIESADLNGKNRKTFYSIGQEYQITALTVSKDYIFWISSNREAILRLSKHQQYDLKPIVYARFIPTQWQWIYQHMAANYTIEEQTLGMKNCEALKSLSHRSTAKKTSGMELQCYGSPCLNYCFKGNCSMSAEGLPNCSCEAGYTGERCKVNVCYKHCLHDGVCSLNEEKNPVCQCTAGYEGERCDVATSTNGVQAENTKQEIGQDLRGEVTQVNIEEFKLATKIETQESQ